MAYYVVKRVKGRAYLYKQESWRVGSKVKTKSRCLGPVGDSRSAPYGDDSAGSPGDKKGTDGDGESAMQHSREVPEERLSRDQLSLKAFWQKAPLQRFKGVITTHRLVAEKLNSRVSVAAIQDEHERTQGMLRRSGLNPLDAPAISIKLGARVGWRRRSIGGYTVRLPWIGKYNQRAFRRAVSETIAHASLEALKAQCPERYEVMRTEWKASHRTTRRALGRYVSAASKAAFLSVNDRIAAAQTVKRFGNLGSLCRKLFPKKKPQAVGLADFNQHRSWEDEAVSIMILVQRRGFSSTYRLYRNELTKARREHTRAEKARQEARDTALIKHMIREGGRGLWSRKRATLRRNKAEARLDACNEMMSKLEILRKTLYKSE